MSKLQIDVCAENFVDLSGRQVILRGVNLGGDCKVPWPDGGTDRPSDFSDHRSVSFVGRPFPLEEADEHLGRIASWGFNTLRLLVTWEAVEHAGPGQYDHAYLDYVAEVVRKAGDYGLIVFIDFHQDCWSRMSGGDGAPGWVFEAVGLDFTRFDAAGAAHVMQHRYDYERAAGRQEDRYPMMSWASNYRRPVNGIMWTAFFAGARLTPDWKVGALNVQDFLQSRYLGAVAVMAERLRDFSHVIGFGSLNEPGLGWIGQTLSDRRAGPTRDDPTPSRPGPSFTPLEALSAAAGLPTHVQVLGWNPAGDELIASGETLINPDGARIWTGPDPFEVAGAWRPQDGRAVALNEDFFRILDGEPLEFERDLMAPFLAKAAAAIRTVRPDWLLFTELSPYVFGTGRTFPDAMPERSVNASHWYDVAILRAKTFDAEADRAPLIAKYMQQLGYLKMMGGAINGGAPTLIGEFGVPFDLNDAEAYGRYAAGERGDRLWAVHAAALAATYDVLDTLQVSSTQWNYTASNRNDLRVGDGWNQEDLSIFSRDQHDDPANPDSGGRAIAGFRRPYAQRTQGRIVSMRFDAAAGRFALELEADTAISEPTEIYLPAARFGAAPSIALSDPEARCEHRKEQQRVLVWAARPGPLAVSITAS